jgi:hypothetical protein
LTKKHPGRVGVIVNDVLVVANRRNRGCAFSVMLVLCAALPAKARQAAAVDREDT